MYSPKHRFKEAQFEPEQEQKMKNVQFHIQLYSNSQVKLQNKHINRKQPDIPAPSFQIRF